VGLGISPEIELSFINDCIKYLENVVLPAPKSPLRQITQFLGIELASFIAIFFVSSSV
jgi:hypothetical protein